MGRLSGVASPLANATSMSRRLQLDWAIRWQHDLSVVARSSQRMCARRKYRMWQMYVQATFGMLIVSDC